MKTISRRWIKNAVAIVVILALCGSMFFTMSYAKSHAQTSNMPQMSQSSDSSGGPGGGGTPPDQSGSSDSNSSQSGDQQNAQGGSGQQSGQPPAKPEDSGNSGQSGTSTQSADNSQSSSDSSKSQDSSQNSSSDSHQNNDQQSDDQNSQGGQPGDSSSMPQGAPGQSSDLSTLYYILFGAESFLLALALMEVIITKGNKRTLRQSFYHRDKIIIFALAVILVTAGGTFLCSKITTDYVLADSGSGTPGQASGQTASYTAVKELTEDTTLKSGSYSSESADENVILATGDIKAALSGLTITKTGDSDGGDNSNFYGTNSGIIAKDGANLTLKNLKVTTRASGANGVFSYGGSATTDNEGGDGTSVTISDSKITTTGDNAGGIMTTGGGTMSASNLTIKTAGTSSAAIRSDRGGGTVNVDGGTYTTTGAGSPAIYSTADITATSAKLIAKASEGIVIEGKNSVTIDDCKLTDDNTTLNGQSTTYKNIFLYQSMSGDAADGQAEFTATNSDITTNKGDTLYVTNTTASINLKNNTITNNDSEGNFLRAQADSWGTSGSNGGNVTLTMTKQKASGNIVIDSISTLDMTMKSGSSYTGTINGDNTAKSIKLTLDKKSKIKLTGDSYVTSLDDADSDYSNIDFNGYTLYVNGTAINK